MASSEERREVAERLRAQARTVSHDRRYLWQRLEIAVNGWRLGAVVDESYVFDNDVLSRLADLIDPTCHARDYGHPDEFRIVKGCSVCNCAWYEDTMARPYRYCPHCGARVVND